MRASRADLWWTIIAGWIWVLIVFVIEMWVASSYGHNEWEKFEYPMYATLVVWFWWLASILKTIINRFHDLNKSGWWALWLLIPPFNAGLLIELLFIGWTKWVNNFWTYKTFQTIPTYDPNIKTTLETNKKKSANNTNSYDIYWDYAENLKNLEQKKYWKTLASTKKSQSTSTSQNYPQTHSTPKVYTKTPSTYKSDWSYNPYSLSWK